MNHEQEEYPVLAFQYADPASLQIGLEGVPLPEVLLRCLKAGEMILPSPQDVTLLFSGNFVASVQDHIEDPDCRDRYNITRGTGFVGGKTMSRSDGGIDVILHFAMLAGAIDFEADPDAALDFLHVVVHELNHAAMYQRQEHDELKRSGPFKSDSLKAAANSIIDEFRAERGALSMVPEESCSWDLDSIAEELSDSLLRTVISYQNHLNVARLVNEVGEVCLVAWKSMAFVLAYETETADRDAAPISDPVSLAWAETCSHSWADLKEILFGLPNGATPLPEAEIQSKTEQLTTLLDRWLTRIGFVWEDRCFTISPKYLSKLDQI